MTRKLSACILFLFFVMNSFVFAQDTDVQSAVDYKINRMKISLHLTDSQIFAIKPVVKDYLIKRQSVLSGIEGQGIIDHVAVKSTLKDLKQHEYQELGKILTEDQMKKWVDKENLMASLNPDSAESSVDDGVGLTPNGANFKF